MTLFIENKRESRWMGKSLSRGVERFSWDRLTLDAKFGCNRIGAKVLLDAKFLGATKSVQKVLLRSWNLLQHDNLSGAVAVRDIFNFKLQK